MAYGFNLPDRDKRYACLLAKHFNAELIDVSLAGASNENIATAVAFGVNQALTKADPSEIVVLVGWTEMDRFEYWNKDQIRISSLFMNRERHLYGKLNKRSNEAELTDMVIKHMWEPCFGYYRLVHAFNYIDNLCRAHKVRVIHLQNIEVSIVPTPNRRLAHASIRLEQYTRGVFSYDTAKAFSDMYNGSNFIDFVFADDSYRLEPGIDDHPSELGHKLWFEKILKKYAGILQ